jgi:hypothetical protein
MPRVTLVLLSFASICMPIRADTCDALKSQIESRIKASGVASFSLSVVAASAPAAGKVVGTCGLGARKIVYTQPVAATTMPSAPKPRKTADAAILTECKDGSMSLGATCK